MKNAIVLFFAITIIASASAQVKLGAKANSLLTDLKKKAKLIDEYAYDHHKAMLTLVSITGKKKLVKVKNEEWPDDTEYIYNILKDERGKVMFTNQVPYSQSGDWYEEFRHYYNDKGNVFAFRKTETVFDNSVKGGLVVKTTLKYYDDNFRVIDQSEQLTDKNQKPLKQSAKMFDFRDDECVIYKDLQKCLAGYKIAL